MCFVSGKIYSVLGALESAMQTMSSPLYSLLYTRTVSHMPDAWLLPGITLACFQLLAYLITKKLTLRNVATNNVDNEKNTDKKSKPESKVIGE